MQATQTANVQPFQFLDAAGALQLSETRDTINNIFFDICGLQQIKQGDNLIISRISRPVVTYEFAKEIATKLYIAINRITGRTDYTRERTLIYLEKNCDTLADWFAIVGIHKLISEEAWQKILELSQLDPETVTDKAGKKQGFSKWYSYYNIEWNYNSPVNDDMLRIVKSEYGLEEERFGQDAILRDIFWKIQSFYEGGMNRSLDALTLDHEKVIHKESVIMDQKDRSGANEGLIERTKTNIKKMFSGGKQ